MQDAMQYGKTPEQAVMEARTRWRGRGYGRQERNRRRQNSRNAFDRITNGKNRDIMQRVYEAQERAERVASRHALERATTRATASDADSYIDHTQEDIAIDLVNSLESERRFLTNLRNGWHLSDAELVNAERMAAGRGPCNRDGQPPLRTGRDLRPRYAAVQRGYAAVLRISARP